MTPRVSVVVPAYQAAWSVGATVASALWQTYVDFELIVVDDGSTDATAEIAAAHGDRVKVIRQPNAGVAAARNRGIAESRGELITFCDADDILFAEHLASLVALYDARGGVVTGNAWWMFPGGVVPGRTRLRGRFPAPEAQRRAILEQNFVSTMSLFPRAMFDEIGPLAEDLSPVDDWEYWMRAIFAGYRVSLRTRPLALYRWSITGLTSDSERMEAATQEVLRRMAAKPGLTAAERAYVERRLSGPAPHTLARLADRAVMEGRFAEASRGYRRAAELLPSERPLVWKSRLMGISAPLAGRIFRKRGLRRERVFGTPRR